MILTQPTQPITMNQWIADQLRSLATKLDGSNIAVPSPEQIRAEHLRTAKIALLETEAEAERQQQSLLMLRKRVDRLSK